MLSPAEIEAILTGKRTKLYPYSRGFWPPEALYGFWQLMREEGALSKVFYGPTGVPESGDLAAFVKFFAPEAPQRRDLLVATSLEAPDQIIGLFWFDDFVPNVRAAAGLFYRRRFWGEPAREASRLAQAYGFRVLELPSIWAYTPWNTGRRHAESAGLKLVATLPGYVIAEGKLTNLMVLRITREEWEGQDG